MAGDKSGLQELAKQIALCLRSTKFTVAAASHGLWLTG